MAATTAPSWKSILTLFFWVQRLTDLTLDRKYQGDLGKKNSQNWFDGDFKMAIGQVGPDERFLALKASS